MDCMAEESALSKLENTELVESQPTKTHDEETITSFGGEWGIEHQREIIVVLSGEQENKAAIKNVKVGGVKVEKGGAMDKVDGGELCQIEQLENENDGGEMGEKEQVIIALNEPMEVHGEEMVTTSKGEAKVKHTREIIVVLKGGEKKEQDMKKVNDEEGKFEDNGAIEKVNDGKERNEQEQAIENVNDGRERSEKERAIEMGNDKGDTKEGLEGKEHLEVRRKEASKLRKRGKKRKIALTGTNSMVIKNVDQGETSNKKRKARIVATSANKDVAKNLDRGESPQKKIKTKDEEALIDANKEFAKVVDEGESSGKKTNGMDKDVAKNANRGESFGKKTKRGGKREANNGNKGESIHKKKKTKVDTMGMIFMCSSKTKKDCYQYKVLGLPASKRDIVLKIYKGMRLFLFDFDLKLLYGIYKAAGPGGYNIEPKAFKSSFPSQVRFTIVKDCLPLAEEKFKKIIKDNYYSKNKFNCQLTSDQVKNLCKLFEIASRGPKSKQSDKGHNFQQIDRSPRAETHISVDHDRRWQKGTEQVRQKDRERERRKDREPMRRKDREPMRRKDWEQERQKEREPERRTDREQERLPISFHDHLHYRHPATHEQYRLPASVQDHLHYRQPATHTPLPLPSPPALPLSYGYDRTFQTEIYQRGPYLDDHERQPIDSALRRQDDIQLRDPFLLHHERRPADLELRHRDEIERRCPYDSYRERPLYRVPLYSSGQQPEYYSLARPPAEYHLSGSFPSEYRSLRLDYPY